MSSPMINNVVLLGCFFCYVFVFLLGIDSRFVDDHVFGILCNVSHVQCWKIFNSATARSFNRIFLQEISTHFGGYICHLRYWSAYNVLLCLSFEKFQNSFVKAMSHGAIFLATCNAILLLRDINLANTRLHYILLMYSSHFKQSSLINIS